MTSAARSPAKRSHVSQYPSRINYAEVVNRYKWLAERGRQCIISPDTDGFLCGLMCSTILGWEIAGFYDGKIMVCSDKTRPAECVFLDMEIYRKGVQSVGQHMLLYNKNRKPANWDNFDSCLNPNNLRGFDGAHDFTRKYPLATIHLLLGIYQHLGLIDHLPREATAPLLFADGLQSIVLKYTENCLDWFKYLGIFEDQHILHKLFGKESLSFLEVMVAIDDFYRVRDSYNATARFEGGARIDVTSRRTGHNFIFSTSDGLPVNLVPNGSVVDVFRDEKERVEGFIGEIGRRTGWTYDSRRWNWAGLRVSLFHKNIEQPMRTDNFLKLAEHKKPLSFANTATKQFEITLEGPDSF